MNMDETLLDDQKRTLSSVSIVGEEDNNGLLFAPTCSTCFNANKYLLVSEKKCSHEWINESLNNPGEYIVFPSKLYHRGYYNDTSNQFFTQAQLFCEPTLDTEVLRLPRSMMKEKGNQISRGCLEPSTLTDFRDDLIENWDTIYGHTNYRPCKKFSGGTVDRATNRQIYKKHFHELPLLKKLVDTFESMLPYLSVDLVWLLRKQKEGDGFQGWHQDFSLGSCITKTIVVNVGSKETQNQDTPVSFGNAFEAEEWEEVEAYAHSVFNNSEDQLHHEPVAIHVNNASVKVTFDDLKPPATTEQEKMFEHDEHVTVNLSKNPSVTAEDDNKPASTLLEETV